MNMLFGNRKREFVPGSRRYEMPIMVSFDEGTYMTAEWNLEGCRLMGYHGKRTAGQAFNIIGIGPLGEAGATVLIHARVESRSWLYSELRLTFDDINEAGFEVLNQLVDRCVADTIQTRKSGKS